MAFPAPPASYDEPTVMWRMERRGMRFHTVIGRNGPAVFVRWALNDYPIGDREFGDWDAAIRWSEQLQAQNWAAGWRLAEPGGAAQTEP